MYDGYSKYDAAQAVSYDADREIEQHWVIEGEFIEQRLGAFSGKRLLDAPVGTGRFLQVYRNVGLVVGMDVSLNMLKIANEKVVSDQVRNVSLSAGNIFSLPFPPNTFDACVCCRVVHLMPPELLASALKELARVTYGDIYLQVYEKGDLLRRILTRVRRFPRNLLRRLYPSAKPEKPWSGIRSYFHSKSAFEIACASVSLKIKERQHLCHYLGHRVVFLVLSKA